MFREWLETQPCGLKWLGPYKQDVVAAHHRPQRERIHTPFGDKDRWIERSKHY